MSHISTYAQKVKDIGMFKQVLRRKGIDFRENCDVQQFGTNTVHKAAIAFTPEGWRYEIALTSQGEIKYDHWGSAAGTMEELGRTIQTYNEEVIMAQVLGEENVMNCYVEEMENGVRDIVIEYAEAI